MERRTFLKGSVAGVTGLAGFGSANRALGNPVRLNETEVGTEAGGRIGRPVRITSISFPEGATVEAIAPYVDAAGSAGVDVIALPELWRGEADKDREPLHGPTVTAMAALAKKHHTYIVCPLGRRSGNLNLNTAVLLDRRGEVVLTYDKIFPYWSEFDVRPKTDVGSDALVYPADFGMLGMAICYDVNFPEVWRRLADKGAELVIWPSAYSAGRSLQAHAINHHYYIVSCTQTIDCLVYDITGEKLLYQKNDKINVASVTLDLDRGIYHENFNIAKRDKLLQEHAADVEMENWLRLEQWFVLKARQPGVSARELARQYGLEELRPYLDRSRRSIDEMRGWQYEARVLFPELDEAGLKALMAKNAGPSRSNS